MAESHQQPFAFADSPEGGGQAVAAGEPAGKAYLLPIAKATAVPESASPADPDEADLLEQVASMPNRASALGHVASNAGAAGVDGRTVDDVVGRSRSLLAHLRDQLRSGRYRPGDIRRVWIPKPGGGQRGLGIPDVVGRWVQQALSQVLEPIFEPTFHDSSHGFRPDRGARTAIAEAKERIEAGYEIVVDLDLSDFFDRVHHQRLMSRLAQRVHDGRVLKLVHRMLKATVVMPDGRRVSAQAGSPQGGPLSPLLSNIVLDELGWALERRGPRFVRYADDVNIYVRSERAGHRVMGSARRLIEGRLRLKVNDAKSTVSTPDRLHVLGFRPTRQSDGSAEVGLSARAEQRIKAQIRAMTPRAIPGVGPFVGFVHGAHQPLSAGMDGLLPFVPRQRGTSSQGL